MPRKPTPGSTIKKRSDTWLKNAFKKVDPNSEVIILENPDIKSGLDQYLHLLWPVVKQHLESTGYAFTPLNGVLKIEGRSGCVLTRAMPWMLHGEYPVFYRGALECTQRHWVIENEFFLSLASSVDFRLIREIIGNSRLSGSPPELTIHKHSPVEYYQIYFHSGNGESWGPQSTGRIIEWIKKCIDANVAMNDFAIDGQWNEEIVGKFLTYAYEAYEAY